MCASSWSSKASTWFAGSPASAPTGTSTTGRNHPTTTGALTVDDTNNCTGRDTRRRVLSCCRTWRHSPDARWTSLERSRSVNIHPPSSRTQNTVVPKSQTATNQGSNEPTPAPGLLPGIGRVTLSGARNVAVEGGILKEAATDSASGGLSKNQVTAGAKTMIASATQAMMYRPFG